MLRNSIKEPEPEYHKNICISATLNSFRAPVWLRLVSSENAAQTKATRARPGTTPALAATLGDPGESAKQTLLLFHCQRNPGNRGKETGVNV